MGGGIFPHITEPDYLVCLSTSSQYQIGSQATPTMLNPLMYKLSYFRFVETDGGRGYDRVRKTYNIMWANAMGKLEDMESSNRERLWPQLVKGFKDLSERLKLQDEVILSNSKRLQMTQTNVNNLPSTFYLIGVG
uniref:Nucleoporin Nup54 alpha-helical domain-containing protein n=1 Tax=Lactuca sativa TaxID=4236 RepID=A0A9R1X250_LACSA|nr:hypothetical protein LSAT_V11C700360410 [Lactuca sativa]